SYLGSATTSFAAPHTYSVPIYRAMAVGDQGYYMITVNVSASASVGKTVKVNGATDPVVFAYITDPNVTNSQTNNAGTQTISAAFGKAPIADNEANAISNNSFTLKNLFPNPANTTFSFFVSGNKNEKAVAQLTDRSGNKLVQKNIEIINGLNQYSMNVSSFISGVYYLVITNASGEAIAKQQVIIQH
ncbi:MAG: T9SS type A sorting domain-containing protein, partial [Parafilimonas sp.]